MKTAEEILSEISGWDIVSIKQPEMQKELTISFHVALRAMESYAEQVAKEAEERGIERGKIIERYGSESYIE